MVTFAIPNRAPLEVAHVLMDVNGTLTNRGVLIQEVAPLVRRLREMLEVHLLSADTFGSLAVVASTLGVRAEVAQDGDEKVEYVLRLGPDGCVAIGNGANDEGMVREAALGIAVIGPEGAAAATVAAADIVCRSISEALSLLLDEEALAATLRR
jgi:soluble P-type ATPase